MRTPRCVPWRQCPDYQLVYKRYSEARAVSDPSSAPPVCSKGMYTVISASSAVIASRALGNVHTFDAERSWTGTWASWGP